MKTAIEVKNLKKHYGEVKAVDGITFSVNQGEIFGMLGPNGASKTTTIEIMPDYIRPVVRAIPLTYLGDAPRQVMVGFPPQVSLRTNILVLTGWLVFSSVLAIRYWKWE
ncbi:MAG: ATP-binding cassette domain-containing protein [Candidatus Bipolaricaulia bacterium]